MNNKKVEIFNLALAFVFLGWAMATGGGALLYAVLIFRVVCAVPRWFATLSAANYVRWGGRKFELGIETVIAASIGGCLWLGGWHFPEVFVADALQNAWLKDMISTWFLTTIGYVFWVIMPCRLVKVFIVFLIDEK